MAVLSKIGSSQQVHDASAKACGTLRYTGDIQIPGTVHVKLLLSPTAHGEIKSFDLSKAEKIEGVLQILHCFNTPELLFNSAQRFDRHEIIEDEQVFSRTLRYKGDIAAAVIAESPGAARKAARLIRMEIEKKEAVFSLEEAMEKNAPQIHPECLKSNILGDVTLSKGSPEEGFTKSDQIFEDRRTSPAIHHLALEPHTVLAEYRDGRKLVIHSSTQNSFAVRLLLSNILHIPRNRIQVIKPAMGGAFGSKIPMILEPIAALAAIRTGRPVKLELSRKELFLCTRTRHASVVEIKTGVSMDGRILAQDIRYLLNAGAYATQSMNVAAAASHKALKLYKTPHFKISSIPVYTNLPVAGAMRGYGSPQLYFAVQTHLKRIADALKIDFVEFQKINLITPDAREPLYNKPIGNPRPLDCVTKGAESFDWTNKYAESGLSQCRKEDSSSALRGCGMAVGMHGNGVYMAHVDFTGIHIRINDDDSAIFSTGTHDMGNGSVTIQKMIISQELKIPLEKIEAVESDTENCPWNLGDFASRGVFVSAEAARRSALKMKDFLLEQAADYFREKGEKLSFEDLILEEKEIKHKNGILGISREDLLVYIYQVKQISPEISGGHANEADRTSYGAHFVFLEINRSNGKVTLLEYSAVHDVGKVLNPISIEGQLEGAVQMAAGYALCEEMIYDDEGTLTNGHLGKYKTITAARMPRKLNLSFIEEGDDPGPYGAKSIGECSVVPGAPAIVNALSHALGEYPENLPVTEEQILKILKRKGLYVPVEQ